MNIHEYQAKELFRKYGVNVPRGQVAFTADEAVKAAEGSMRLKVWLRMTWSDLRLAWRPRHFSIRA